MVNCVMCGSPIPDNQGSSSCSMCYGDIGHGRDGYYQEWAEEQERQEQEKMILLPDKPSVGDVICLDSDQYSPNDFCKDELSIGWYSSTVIGIKGNSYKVNYDDGERWYEFKEFSTPFYSKHDTGNLIYCALPPIPKEDKQ